MTSTEQALAAARLPPVPGLLDDLLKSVMRARQRRVTTIDHPGQTLGALRVADNAIDRALVAAALYGPQACQLMDDWLQNDAALQPPGARSAWVFVRVALALQMRHQQATAHRPAQMQVAHDSDWLQQVEQHLAGHPRAVHDALRFAPMPAMPLQDDTRHVAELLARAGQNTALMPMALQLVGERDVKALGPAVQALAGGPWAAVAHHALASLGLAAPGTRAHLQDGLSSGQPDAVAAAMRTAAVDPRLASDQALAAALPAGPAAASAAWAILLCRYARHTHDHALSLSDADGVDLATKLRVAALAGFMDSTIMVCAAVAERDEPITPAERDVLFLVLGAVPMAAACRPPGPRQAKSQALRQLVLQVCRAAHLQLHNDADTAPWEAGRILADLAQAAAVRVRGGRRMQGRVPALGTKVFELTHGLRQWLYIERAAYGGHALALDAGDVSRRQTLALAMAGMADALDNDHAAQAA